MSDNNSIAALRKVYQLKSLLEKEVNDDPVKQFENWWQEAINSQAEEPNAMTLATCSASGRPSARIVYLKVLAKTDSFFLPITQAVKHRK
jgi:pyridoxamine 5'-phosphate oxidase